MQRCSLVAPLLVAAALPAAPRVFMTAPVPAEPLDILALGPR